MFTALDDTETDSVVWMPAHTKEEDIGRAYLGNGTRLTHLDRKGNEEADRLAKLAVEAHRVPKQVQDRIKEFNLVVEDTARWVARATYAAGHQTVRPFRDTEASRAAAVATARVKALAGGAKRSRAVQAETALPATLGGRGHTKGAKEKAKRTPRWPVRGAARRRRVLKKRKRYARVEVETPFPRDLKPLVHALTAAERRAALLQRVRAKEAASKATPPPDAARLVGGGGGVEIATSRSQIMAKRPHGLQHGAGAGVVGAASKRLKAAME
jgi:hypothetical protein